MGIFDNIWNKITGKSGTPTATKTGTGFEAPVFQTVDVEAVLKQMAAKKGGGGNYKETPRPRFKPRSAQETCRGAERERGAARQCRAEHRPAQGGARKALGKRRQGLEIDTI
jgi:hypothetical protein